MKNGDEPLIDGAFNVIHPSDVLMIVARLDASRKSLKTSESLPRIFEDDLFFSLF